MMKNINYNFQYISQHYSELYTEYQALIDQTIKSKETSYSPYSNFQVGASVLLDDGEIISASNQESEAFPSGICAERNLLYFVQANYIKRGITALCVTASPCGACRQVILDTEKRNGKDIKILIINSVEEIITVDSAKNLLPLQFTL